MSYYTYYLMFILNYMYILYQLFLYENLTFCRILEQYNVVLQWGSLYLNGLQKSYNSIAILGSLYFGGQNPIQHLEQNNSPEAQEASYFFLLDRQYPP